MAQFEIVPSLNVEGRTEGMRYKNVSGLTFELDVFEVSIESISVLFSENATEFDPSDPPAGFSLCHNGHCHADSGELVPYDEIVSTTATNQTTISVQERVDLLGDLNPIATEATDLDRGTVSLIRVVLSELKIEGTAFHDSLPMEGVPFSVSVDDIIFNRQFTREVGVESDDVVDPEVRLSFPVGALDGITVESGALVTGTEEIRFSFSELLLFSVED